MRVAMTGATGFIGGAAAETLAARGHELTALARETSHTAPIESHVSRFVRGDQADPGAWPDLLDRAEILVHNAVDWDALRSGDLGRHLEANVVANARLFESAHEAGVRRIVFVSSVATHHEVLPQWDGVVDESHPLRPASPYGAAKAAVECFLWWAKHSLGMETVALRPAGVYGVEPIRLERSIAHRAVSDVVAGRKVGPETHGGGGKWVAVEDVAAAIGGAVEREQAAGRVFNLADCYAKKTRFAEHAAAYLGTPELVTPDTSPPAKNRFSKEATREGLGVSLDRGDEGLRAYAERLVDAIRSRSDR